ncbi:unnamed protein product [Trichogramma brassicae]|uniref:Uncharacterized protein n=1 Tax=Trichogramma brassicae TaxID=86971 RepID=A0A6H5IQZ8_9HYME|nr:unnamed protein product [Trichogramma brassicae]
MPEAARSNGPPTQTTASSPRERRKKNLANIIKTQAIEFCLSTSLHGYKYIVQKKRSKVERCVWAAIVVSSLIFSLVLMHIAWTYNAAHSTLTVIETTHHGIWNYPFPAVTICNNNQISRDKARNFVQKFGGPTEPRRLTACGYQTGLEVLVDARPRATTGPASLQASYGVKVMLHDPHDYRCAAPPSSWSASASRSSSTCRPSAPTRRPRSGRCRWGCGTASSTTSRWGVGGAAPARARARLEQVLVRQLPQLVSGQDRARQLRLCAALLAQKRENVDERTKLSLINVFFTDLVSIQYRRYVYYDWKALFDIRRPYTTEITAYANKKHQCPK